MGCFLQWVDFVESHTVQEAQKEFPPSVGSCGGEAGRVGKAVRGLSEGRHFLAESLAGHFL